MPCVTRAQTLPGAWVVATRTWMAYSDACRSDVTAPLSPVREASKDLSSHPLPPSPVSSPYWWDLPQDALWPEEEAQSELRMLLHLTICIS